VGERGFHSCGAHIGERGKCIFDRKTVAVVRQSLTKWHP
jgi:hypothetical protein